MSETHKLEQYLKERNVPYELVSHEHSATSIESAHAAKVDAGRLVKAVLLEGDDRFLAALTTADQEVRVGQLTHDYGPHLHLADQAEIHNLFEDCEPGVVPGLPLAWGVDTIWDDDLLTKPDVYLDAGDHERLLHVETRYLKNLFSEMPHCHFSMPLKHH